VETHIAKRQCLSLNFGFGWQADDACMKAIGSTAPKAANGDAAASRRLPCPILAPQFKYARARP
jgi:hypothetical protein